MVSVGKAVSFKPKVESRKLKAESVAAGRQVFWMSNHSGNIIPATYWIRLIEKQRLHEISTNEDLRKKERKFVTQVITEKQTA